MRLLKTNAPRNRRLTQPLIAALALFIPGMLYAAEPTAIPGSPLRPEQEKRFIPLRKTSAQPKLRGDARSMNNGFMRIDRHTIGAITARPTPIPPVATARESAPTRIITGASSLNQTPVSASVGVEAESGLAPTAPIANAPSLASNPILGLFDIPTTLTARSFRETLLSKSSKTAQAEGALSVRHLWPLPPAISRTISSPYGERNDPISQKGEFHSGVDFSAPTGTDVYASASGQVVDVSEGGSLGKSITLHHRDGSESQYGHLSRQQVKVGQQVQSGQTIGNVGNTGRTTGSHLHYGLRMNGLSVDPLPLMEGGTSIARTSHTTAPPTRPEKQRVRIRSPINDRLIVVK